MTKPEVIFLHDQYYIPAKSTLVDEDRHALMHQDIFAVVRPNGDIGLAGRDDLEYGLFYRGTRFLSIWRMEIFGMRPLLLSSSLKGHNDLLTIDLTNPDLEQHTSLLSRGEIHFFRSLFVYRNALYERLRLTSFAHNNQTIVYSYHFDCDFKDLFEVRGIQRKQRGTIKPVQQINNTTFTCAYFGLDGIERMTNLVSSQKPQRIEKKRVVFEQRLRPGQSIDHFLTIACVIKDKQKNTPRPTLVYFPEARRTQQNHFKHLRENLPRIETSNEQFNDWINRSVSDLMMLLAHTPYGWYPYAGIPWFSTVFGRDAIITAMFTLWMYPFIAKGVLRYLAATQAKDFDPRCDAEPGKIIHEMRDGEMAACGEIPFKRYYGTIDATPLFCVLAGRYFEQTGDLELIDELWPALMAALNWMDQYGDKDGDGFIEYERRAIGGLSHQGWKDSEDPVFHHNGILAAPPIALCEVQGYVYEAKHHLMKLAHLRKDSRLAQRLKQDCRNLKKAFHEAFWDSKLQCYGIALDKDKALCRIKTSNAGHCLSSGIVPSQAAKRLMRTLLSNEFHSGWGLRTLAASQPRYNPMSYHNGSVWPHDNAMIAQGFGRYHNKNGVIKILTGLFDATLFLNHRLPELFCGFTRRFDEGPTRYPVSCNPQAWASASVFALLQSMLGLRINAAEREIVFDRPSLPQFLEEVRILNLPVGNGRISVLLRRHPEDVSLRVLQRKGGQIHVTVLK